MKWCDIVTNKYINKGDAPRATVMSLLKETDTLMRIEEEVDNNKLFGIHIHENLVYVEIKIEHLPIPVYSFIDSPLSTSFYHTVC